jgi:16S rRNA (cytidine1402-2'-O)-methyltransferase
MDPGLYIVGTPIGHLADITLRALETLRNADCIFAEDTRRTRKLLTHYEIRKPLLSCHKFNEAVRSAGIAERLGAGEAVALVTDSGMPCISDPGGRVVAACREAGARVVVVPGPSSVSSAAAWSGLVSSGYHFEGFLPVKPGARRRRLEALTICPLPVLFFESPYRIKRLLAEWGGLCPERRLFLAREMTKRFEEGIEGTAHEVLEQIGERTVKGECVLVSAGCDKKDAVSGRFAVPCMVESDA